jgi:hypothetical protein
MPPASACMMGARHTSLGGGSAQQGSDQISSQIRSGRSVLGLFATGAVKSRGRSVLGLLAIGAERDVAGREQRRKVVGRQAEQGNEVAVHGLAQVLH